MKKAVLIAGVFLALLALAAYVNKWYYPPVPISGINAKEAIDRLKNTDRKIVDIASENGQVWYIIRTENKGVSFADENVKQMLAANGWKFKQKDGSGLFFEKDGDRLIASTQMWTKKYVLVKVPENW
ncbi:hypothetical protein WKH31_19405 [Metabacillus indicus]|uniref:hypothetical protein n=1 Tax=Metabacillus indicus TaxID=246786 RepID=UPI0031797E09